jgi:uncharacterized protein
MEVKLDKRYPVAATPAQAWAVLSDMHGIAACMPGAAITEQLDATHYKGTVKSKIGPAVMSFGGDIELQGLDETTRELKMLGKGADKAGSSASMQLTARLEDGETPGTTVLVGQATITVSGKLAQFGSRLLVPVSDAMLAQFAGNFSKVAGAVALAPAAADAAATPAAQAEVGVLPATVGAEAAAVPAVAPSTALAPAPASTLPAAASQPLITVHNRASAFSSLTWGAAGWLAGLFGRRPT